MLSKHFFRKNRKKLADLLPENSYALFTAKDPYIKGDGPHFSQTDSNLFYFSGIEQEETLLLIGKEITYLFISRPNPKKELWEGKQLKKNDAKKISGIKEIYYKDEFEKIVSYLFNKKSTLYVPEFIHEISTPSFEHFLNNLKNKYSKITTSPVTDLIKPLRQIKEKDEINEIKKAISITKQGFISVLKNLKHSKTEADIEAELSYNFTKNKAKHSYHPIVASGINATTLHYIKNNEKLKKNQLVLIDSGAEINNYKADITRTLPISGKFTKRQKEIYGAVLRIQEYAISLIKPGVIRKEYEIEVIKKTAKELVSLKLLPRSKINDLIEKLKSSPSQEELKRLISYVRPYYPHSTSHFLGLDTHDIGDYNSPMKEGEVITVEPGIYCKKENIGIRIEDNVLITKKGCENLSKAIPKKIKEIEKIYQ